MSYCTAQTTVVLRRRENPLGSLAEKYNAGSHDVGWSLLMFQATCVQWKTFANPVELSVAITGATAGQLGETFSSV